MRVVVAGGGVAGLGAALALARSGHEVTVCERDTVAAGEPLAAFHWDRKGIAHFHLPHAFLPRGRLILLRHFPDLISKLLDAGASELHLASRIPADQRIPEDHELTYLSVRRPLIEWVLRDAVLRQPNVRVISGARVTGLAGERGEVPRITGLLTQQGKIAADLVVDAMGRTSPAAAWIAQLGAPELRTDSAPSGIIYYARYYRMLPGNAFPTGPWLTTPRGDLGYGAFATFTGDNGTFAIILGIPPGDSELRILQREAAFTAACGSIPALAELVDAGFSEPITPVMAMGNLQNTRRHYTRDGKPVVTGLVPAGDALCHTDPTFALGLSLSLNHAVELAAAAAQQGDASAVARAYFAGVEAEVAERYRWACDTDEARARAWAGEPLDFTRPDGCYPLFMLVAAGAVALTDREVYRKVLRRIGFLDSVRVLDDDRALQERIAEKFRALLASASGPPQRSGPSRDDLLRIAGSAAGESGAAPATA